MIDYSKKQYDPEILKRLQKVQVEILSDFIQVCKKYDLPYFVVYGTAIGAVRHKGFIPWDDDTDVAMLREDYDRFLEIMPKELGDKYQMMTPKIDKHYACTVTHLQRKGTKFVSEISKDMKCDMCIDLDIFPLDNIPSDEKKARKQERAAFFWGKLLFLCGTGNPIIRIDGFKGFLAKYICKITHLVLKVFHVSPRYIYKKFTEASIKYNNEKTEFVTSFEVMNPLKTKMKRKAIFPLKEVPYENIMVNIANNNHEYLTDIYGDYMKLPSKENRINHMPYILQFEGEDPVIKNGVVAKK